MLAMLACTQLDDIEALNYDNLEAVAKLSSSTRYKDVMKASREREAAAGAGLSLGEQRGS